MVTPDTRVEKKFQRDVFAVVPVRRDPSGTIVYDGVFYTRVVSSEEHMDIEFLYLPPDDLGLVEEVSVQGKVRGELDAFPPRSIPFRGYDLTSGKPITVSQDVIYRYIDQLMPDKNTPAYYTIFWTSGEGQSPEAQLVVYKRRDPHMSLPVPASPDRRLYGSA